MSKQSSAIAILFALVAVCLTQSKAEEVTAEAEASAITDTDEEFEDDNQNLPDIEHKLELLKSVIDSKNKLDPKLFDQNDVEDFFNDRGAVSARRVLMQRGADMHRAVELASTVLAWRNQINLRKLSAKDFPCDLFSIGLIFEHGHAHNQKSSGEYEDTNPVIWLRLGALGGVIKDLEKPTASRLLSAAYHARSSVKANVGRYVNKRRDRKLHLSRRAQLKPRRSPSSIKNTSIKKNSTINFVLQAIAWWLEDWVKRNPSTQATFVLDFENSDGGFVSWSIGDFVVKLDERFPDLFDRIIGFRFTPKLWRAQSVIGMFNRIFKTRVSSSRETDEKLAFVKREPDIGVFLPRVNSEGYTLLPPHVSGTCMGPDNSKAPQGCLAQAPSHNGIDPLVLKAIHHQYYYSCKAKPIVPHNPIAVN